MYNQIRFKNSAFPTQAPAGSIIMNAPRPLMGTEAWIGDFFAGVFWAAIDPADDNAQAWIASNQSNDATLVIFMNDEVWQEAVEDHYAIVVEQNRINPDDFDFSDSELESFYWTWLDRARTNHMNWRGLDLESLALLANTFDA